MGFGHRCIEHAHAAATNFFGLVAGQCGGCLEQRLGILDQGLHVVVDDLQV